MLPLQHARHALHGARHDQPYGRGHAAVKDRFQISDDPRENAGRIIRDGTGRERTYVHGDILENKALLANDPDYIKTLDAIKDPKPIVKVMAPGPLTSTSAPG